jgi:branched-subunit amino acid aminotransferase/4-amino-4-deoxychorismate lyase
LAKHKTLNYWANLIAREKASRSNATEVAFLDTRGYLTEGSCTNLFLVRKGRLCTPSLKANILPGITRAAVIGLAVNAGLKVREGMFRLRDLRSAQEAFMTNSLMEIMPIRRVDGGSAGEECPGPLTRKIMAMYADLIRQGK